MLSNIVKLFVDTKKEKTILSEKEKDTALLKDLSEKGSKSSIRRCF